MKLGFSLQIYDKIYKYQILWKSDQWSRVVPCGWTDRHEEANSRFFFAILRTRLKTNSFGQLRDCYISAGIFLYSNYVEVSVDDDDFKHKTRKTQRQLCVYAFWDLTAI